MRDSPALDVLDPAAWRAAGWTYHGSGRPSRLPVQVKSGNDYL